MTSCLLGVPNFALSFLGKDVVSLLVEVQFPTSISALSPILALRQRRSQSSSELSPLQYAFATSVLLVPIRQVYR